MKHILILLFISINVMADEYQTTPPPTYLKDGTIEVQLKNGKTSEFSANDWMVVPRRKKIEKPKQVKEVKSEQIVEELRLNRVRLLGGAGPNGLKSVAGSSSVLIESKYTPVVGVGYDRSFGKYSLGVSGYTNGTVSLGAGLDF